MNQNGSAQEFSKKVEAAALEATAKDQVYGMTKISGAFKGLAPSDYFLGVNETSGEKVAIDCALVVKPPGYCRGYIDITPNMKVMYQYTRDCLADWQAVHNGITQLFRKFAKED